VICDLEQRYASRSDNTGEVQSPTLQDENPRCSLNWLCLTLLKALFCDEDFLQDENLRSTIRRRRRLWIISFLKASLSEKLDF
jgi:hypothetical protein